MQKQILKKIQDNTREDTENENPEEDTEKTM